ncbi:MAG: transketolase, partial [Planctomycetota bacterium]|nr:transketolase [Planctomycetota bacterium]
MADWKREILAEAARAIRLGILELSHAGRAAHIGSCLSVADILAAVYWGGLDITPENAACPDR